MEEHLGVALGQHGAQAQLNPLGLSQITYP
jgi:hypothetical protein